MSQSLIRFMIGGVMVSAFAIIGDVLKPKSFAGLSGADRGIGWRLLCCQ